jgi:hypothetical protein
MTKRITIAILLLVSVAVAARREYTIKSSHLGLNAVAITCENGGDPTGKKYGDVLIISCGKWIMDTRDIKQSLERIPGVTTVGRDDKGTWRVLLLDESAAARDAIADICQKHPFEIKTLDEFNLGEETHHGRVLMRLSPPEAKFHALRSIHKAYESHASRSARRVVKSLLAIGENDHKGMVNMSHNPKWIAGILRKYEVADYLLAYATCLVGETMREHLTGAHIREEFFAEGL